MHFFSYCLVVWYGLNGLSDISQLQLLLTSTCRLIDSIPDTYGQQKSVLALIVLLVF